MRLMTYHMEILNSEKYSRGRRGAPAKGVGRATGARVQIPLSPFRFITLVKRNLSNIEILFFRPTAEVIKENKIVVDTV